ncbi:MAG: hypothetical protein R3B07_16795 [Polyangiaceae bacterium]
MLRRLSILCATFVITAFTANAQASEPETHDGFYFSAAVGAGYLSSSVDDDFAGTSDPSLSGFGFAAMLLFGGTPAPGLVVGGGSMGGHFPTPEVEQGGAKFDSQDDLALSLTGAFVDYYFNPKSGFHALGMLGFAALSPGGDADLATGWGAALGVGHDWFVSEEWSLGVMGRLQYLSTSVEQSFVTNRQVNYTATYTTLVPALTFNVVYH